MFGSLTKENKPISFNPQLAFLSKVEGTPIPFNKIDVKYQFYFHFMKK